MNPQVDGFKDQFVNWHGGGVLKINEDMMLEGQDFQITEGHPRSGGKNFVNEMSNKFNKLMG